MMMNVVPSAELTSLQASSGRFKCRFTSCSQWVFALVRRFPGQYTVSKLDAFAQFRATTSSRQVAAILLLTPMPCLVLNLLIEAIPLADPKTGFHNSMAFQFRHFFSGLVHTILPVLEKKKCVPDFPTGSWKMTAAFGISQSLVAIITNAIISLTTGVFPVFFAHFTPTIPMIAMGTLVCYHRQRWGPEMPDFRANSTHVDRRLAMTMLPLFVYPIFTALFMVLPPRDQLWLSLLLPVMKMAVRRWLWLITRKDEDLVGVITCCAGHLYHILFTDVILQNAKSIQTLAVIIVFNTGQMLVNCRYILKDATAIKNASKKLEKEHEVLMTEDFVHNALRFTIEDDIAAKLHAKQPSALLSTYAGYHEKIFLQRHRNLVHGDSSLSLASFAHVMRLSNTGLRRMQLDKSGPKKSSLALRSNHVQVLPLNNKGIFQANPVSNPPLILQLFDAQEPLFESLSEQPSTTTREVYIDHVTIAQHQTEIILLRSYVTIFATLFYVIYLLCIFSLPNRDYFATLDSLSTISDVGSTSSRLLLLCGLEIVFLSIYLTLIRRQFGTNGLYQLAFVISSQQILVQAKFTMLSLVVLGFPLAHYGNGIMFHFNKES